MADRRRNKWGSLDEREEKNGIRGTGSRRRGGGGCSSEERPQGGGRLGQGSSLWCELAASTWPQHVARSPPGQSERTGRGDLAGEREREKQGRAREGAKESPQALPLSLCHIPQLQAERANKSWGQLAPPPP